MKTRFARKAFFGLLSVGFFLPSLSGVAAASVKDADRLSKIHYAESQDEINLKIYNSEDYIAEDETDDEGNLVSEGIIRQFEEYEKSQGKNVHVSYSCFDTNENMLSQLRMGSRYDLVCTSDYVVQRMIRQDMVIPFEEEDAWESHPYSSTPNYGLYASPFIKERISGIDVEKNGKRIDVNQYARGYMWGTLGILYNEDFAKLKERHLEPETVEEDMQDWLSLWDSKYKNLLTIKDSMRDTYAVGIMKTFDGDFRQLLSQYEAGTITAEDYNEKIHALFNQSDEKTVRSVEKDLESLRDNAYGFEVDSGKSDMARGKFFAINLAWSGDATWAMDMADEYNEEHEESYPDDTSFEPTVLKYAIPKTGANIWFDAWVMPKSCREDGNEEYAHDFIDFISDPEKAAENMDYIGYTPVIGGEAVLDYVKENYGDVRASTDENGDPVWDDSAKTLEAAKEGVESGENYTKNLAYFFGGTLEATGDDLVDATTFYLPVDEKDKQFDTAYPDESILPKLVIMDDYGDNNGYVVDMWTRVKAKFLPLWVYIVVAVLLLALVVYFLVLGIDRHAKKAMRKRRRGERLAHEKRSAELTKILTEDFGEKDVSKAK